MSRVVKTSLPISLITEAEKGNYLFSFKTHPQKKPVVLSLYKNGVSNIAKVTDRFFDYSLTYPVYDFKVLRDKQKEVNKAVSNFKMALKTRNANYHLKAEKLARQGKIKNTEKYTVFAQYKWLAINITFINGEQKNHLVYIDNYEDYAKYDQTPYLQLDIVEAPSMKVFFRTNYLKINFKDFSDSKIIQEIDRYDEITLTDLAEVKQIKFFSVDFEKDFAPLRLKGTNATIKVSDYHRTLEKIVNINERKLGVFKNPVL